MRSLGGCSDHDVGKAAAQYPVWRVVVEAAAGDEQGQQIWFGCDHGQVESPPLGQLFDVPDGLRELQAAVEMHDGNVPVDLPGQVDDDSAVLAA